MKKIIIAAAIILPPVILFSSCNKLEENPLGNLTPGSFYQTQADAIAAVTAVYSTLSTDVNNDFPIYGRNLNLLVDNTSDNQVYSPSNTNPDVRALGTATYVSTNDRVHKIYAQLYWGVNKANIAIDKIPSIPEDQFQDPTHTATNLINEARFLRALHYFNLVRLFGDVPLMLHDLSSLDLGDLKVNRTPKDSVYLQIIADLDAAAATLPAAYNGSNTGRVTSGAAHALLAKVYTTRHDWINAKAELEKVISAGTGFSNATGQYGYDLFQEFSDAFQPATKNGKEHIFSAQFNGTAGGFVSNQNISSFTWTTSAYTSDIPADSTVVVNLFDIADRRRSTSFYDSLFNQTTQKWVRWPFYNFFKFVDQSSGITANLSSQGANSKVNFPVIRYAEILLLYAEVLNEINGTPTEEAYKAINIVRSRAFNYYTGNGTYSKDIYDLPVGLNQSDFRDTVFNERRREFIQESQRWFDLVRRTDKGPGQYYLQSVHAMPGNPKIAAALKDTLFPIPQTEIDLYGGSNPNFQQNPGW